MNSQKFLTCIVIFIILLPTALYSENLQEYLPNSDPLVRNLKRDFLLQGKVFPFPSGPFTVQEIQSYQAIVGQVPTQTPNRRLYQEEGFTFDIDPTLSLELRSGLTYGYGQQKPFLILPLQFWALENFYFTYDFTLKYDPFYVLDHPELGTNVVTDLSGLDFSFPFNGGFSIGGPHWHFQLQKGPISWGPGQTGKLTFSEDAGSLEHAGFSLWFDRFKFTFLTVNQDVYKYDPNEASPPWGFFTSAEVPDISAPNSRLKFLLAHRYDVKPFDNLRLSLNEFYLIKSDTFDFRYLNPFLVFHNWFLSLNANSDISLEAEWAPLPGLNLYGQWYIDYMKTEYKQATYNDPTPGSYAYQLGLEWAVPLFAGYLSGGLEWVYTDPFFYLNNRVNMTVTKRYLSNYAGKNGEKPGGKLYELPFGYKYGPDSQVFFAQSHFDSTQGWTAGLSATLLQKGDITFRTLHPLIAESPYYAGDPSSPDYQNKLKAYLDITTPTGPNPIQKLTLEPSFQVDGSILGLSPDLSVYGSLFLIWTWDRDHVPGQNTYETEGVLGLTWTWK